MNFHEKSKVSSVGKIFFFYLQHNQIEVYGQFWQKLSFEKISNFWPNLSANPFKKNAIFGLHEIDKFIVQTSFFSI